MLKILIICCTLLLPIRAVKAQNRYEQVINNWHSKRIESLKAENGWLNLVGLFWLEEGKNTFGSDQQNNIVFPSGSIATKAGYFERKGNIVKLVAADDVNITINGNPVKEAIIFHPDSTKTPTVVAGNLKWTIIKRDNKIGIRLRDIKSLALATFKGIERFPIDSTWKIEATIQSSPKARIEITNVLGQTNEQQSPGKLLFTLNGKQYSLDALEEGNELFIIFGDATSGKTTYPAGRFLYANKPDANGKTILDFNKAYNPPCAFTDFATCPLPPKQNILQIAITAGEKDFDHH
ncbi:DUF1684 domain-containing protein [Parasediminibacterium paludis]|uniref:DUF1684 domain-containing protein n=1 Tax=Parasediminibacterium paludis TaxID=908966 RepID=A0ABV8Q1R4_9BACT